MISHHAALIYCMMLVSAADRDMTQNTIPVVLIPGVQGRWEWMSAAIDALAERCRVISFSLCDEPSSGFPFEESQGLGAYVEQVREAMLQVARRLPHGRLPRMADDAGRRAEPGCTGAAARVPVSWCVSRISDVRGLR